MTIEGLRGKPTLEDVAGYCVANDRARTGNFDSSNGLLKKIYEITVHTYANLCTGGMTVDCPHRERLGYGGDGHASIDLAVDAFGSAAFLSKWAQDWCDMQEPDGRVSHSAPTVAGGGGPAWSGFILALPWEIYLAYGDQRILERTFPFSRKWLAHLGRHVGQEGLLLPLSPGKWQYEKGSFWLFLGDWVAPGRNETSESAEALLFNNCYYLYVLGLAARMAKILGHEDDAQRLKAQSDDLRLAIHRRFFNSSTAAYLDTKQAHCVMPLLSGAVTTDYIKAVEQNLEKEILENCQGHFDTGMHGTYFLVKYLTEHSRDDLIFACATQMTYPGYGHLVANGQTAWPEEWHQTDSRLHGTLNGIGGWFQRGLAGIRADPEAAGYKKIIIQPAPVGDLTWVKAHHDCPYGRISSEWHWEAGIFRLEVEVPPNTTATICLPGREGQLRSKGEASLLRQTKEAAIFEAEPGKHVFESLLASNPPARDR